MTRTPKLRPTRAFAKPIRAWAQAHNGQVLFSNGSCAVFKTKKDAAVWFGVTQVIAIEIRALVHAAKGNAGRKGRKGK